MVRFSGTSGPPTGVTGGFGLHSCPMKTAKLLSVLILSSTLLTTACTPKDEAITDKATRDRILAQKNRRSGKQAKSQQESFRFGSYSVTSLQAEKMVEALEVISLALGYGDLSKSIYSKNEEEKTSDGVRKVVLKTETAPVLFSTKRGLYSGVVRKSWDIDISEADGKLGKLSAKAIKTAASVDLKDSGQKGYVNFKEDMVDISATSLENGVIKVVMKAEGFMNIGVGSVRGSENFNYQIEFSVLESDLASDAVSISKASGQFVAVRKNGKNWVTSFPDFSGKVVLEGQCNVLEGSLKMGGKNSKYMEFSSEGALVKGSSFDTGIGQCGRRPTVDLSRMFLN